ncbi:hypothetical protein DPMN_057046 [Dreissena polymorpha]|uniref:Uncharacterized protein n=1 Tax=Dreissena polymorpha TaxID=45954 RepID=A0A9D4CUE7_DREPO|nr:hypothetical protein DPMN_057046 [Dreissena polymorpha]
MIKTSLYDKRDDFNFEIVNFPFLDGNIPKGPSYGIYISQLFLPHLNNLTVCDDEYALSCISQCVDLELLQFRLKST